MQLASVIAVRMKFLRPSGLYGTYTDAVIVNTARGQLIDEAALVDGLKSGRIAAAGLDVFVSELADAANPLFDLPNVVVSPHVAWLTPETCERSLVVAVENWRRLRPGERLLHRVV